MGTAEFHELKPMLEGIELITIDERQGRLEMARRRMAENGLDAVFLEAGSTLDYFTGVRWGRSERMTAAVLPANGEIAYVCPAFEEARLREMLLFGDDVRGWEEHESPFERVAGILSDRGAERGRIGMEESVRFFLANGIRRALPGAEIVSAEPATIPARGLKSTAEIALIQRAMEITAEAFKACIARLHEGMSQAEFGELSVAAHKALGADGHITVQFGTSSAFPHGSREMTYLMEGDVVLMDGGCTIEGYHSDISRTVVFGEPTDRQREIWALEQTAQAA